jgi:hypothetical protein
MTAAVRRFSWRTWRGFELPGSALRLFKGAPTDPDAPLSGIRFLGLAVSLPVTIRHCRVNTFVDDSEFIP